jgi:diguanylate cyclase (GGDEF)-like protein
MRALAETIQNDQALTAKVLKTVNSSLFGLRQKCSNINQAIIMLGMSAVKTLALGFSLVSAIKDSAEGFDLNEHWRRSLFTAAAAKTIASKAGIGNQEEAFLGGLLQDVGVVAMLQTMGAPYAEAIAATAGDHRMLAKLELDKYQLQHPDLGAMLAQRWKLPDTLVMPIKYHERPTAAPAEHASLCRAVGLGNIASDVLTLADPVQALRKYYERSQQWFGLDATKADEVLKCITLAAREMATLLSVPTGAMPDTAKVLESAKNELAKIVVPVPDDAESLAPIYSMGAKSAAIDELTGVASAERFEQSFITAFEQARAGLGGLGLVVFELDDERRLLEVSGEDARDTTLIYVSSRLTRVFSAIGGVVARLSDSRFAVLVQRQDRTAVSRAAELARTAIAIEPVTLIAAKAGSPGQVHATVSAGVVWADATTIDTLADCQAMMKIAQSAVRVAQKNGRNTVRVYQPAAA